jgi:hypothetical protein
LHAAAICLINSAARLLITAHRLAVTAMPVRPAIDAADPDDRPETRTSPIPVVRADHSV